MKLVILAGRNTEQRRLLKSLSGFAPTQTTAWQCGLWFHQDGALSLIFIHLLHRREAEHFTLKGTNGLMFHKTVAIKTGDLLVPSPSPPTLLWCFNY